MAYFSGNNIRLYYEVAGKGEPVVFLHGSFSRGDAAFAAQIPVFARTHMVIVPDLRGHGRSTAAPYGWETPQLAGDILHLLDDLRLPLAHIVGHSMGGDVAMYCAMQDPWRVKTVTSIASAGVASDIVKTYVNEYHPERMDENIRERFIRRIQNDHYPAHQGDWRSLITETIRNCERYPDFTDADLRAIAMPFLLIYGEDDPMVRHEEVEKLRKNVARFSAHVVTGADHYLHMPGRKADAVNALVLDFLRRARA